MRRLVAALVDGGILCPGPLHRLCVAMLTWLNVLNRACVLLFARAHQ